MFFQSQNARGAGRRGGLIRHQTFIPQTSIQSFKRWLWYVDGQLTVENICGMQSAYVVHKVHILKYFEINNI